MFLIHKKSKKTKKKQTNKQTNKTDKTVKCHSNVFQPGSSKCRVSPTRTRRYCKKGWIHWMGNPRTWLMSQRLMAPHTHAKTMLLRPTPNPVSLSVQFPCLRIYLSSCQAENDSPSLIKGCLTATPIGSWQLAVRNHQLTSWSVLVQKATVWYCLIPSSFSADHHCSRSWACCSHSRWHSDHRQGWWTAYPESELCSQSLRQLRLATPAHQVEVHTAISNLYGLRHLYWRDFPNGG